MRNCTQCNVLKPLTDFHNNVKRIDYECKACKKARTTAYRRTKEGLLIKVYNQQRSTSRRRKHIMPSYTKKAFLDAILAMPLFHTLYHTWVTSNYKKDLVPSIDRLDDSKPYTEDNIQLMTWKENNSKARKDIVAGKIIAKDCRAVLQYTIEGKLVEEYASPTLAARAVGLASAMSIQQALNKSTKKGTPRVAGGYVWKLK